MDSHGALAFFNFCLSLARSSALQRQISDAWTRGDRNSVDRAIACGLNFYSAMAIFQITALLAVAYWALPFTTLHVGSYPLIIKLLWLQAITAPCYGFSVVVSSVLQAARRYDFVPRYELLIIIVRFLILAIGLGVGVDFFWVVTLQTIVQVSLGLGPALWVMVHELGHTLHFQGARWADYKSLAHISLYMSLIQISVVLADRLDIAVLGFLIPADSEAAITVYGVVSKPFLQLRQTGWMLAYMVMPAVASLAAAHDLQGMDRIKYDGTRLHVGVLLPIGLLACIYAAPFLALWIGFRQWEAIRALGYDLSDVTYLMRLFFVGAIPLVLSVSAQMCIGLNKIKIIALSAIGGSIVNLPISCYLTSKLGVSGVIWGTVLTTLFSNLLIPGIYIFRVLRIDLRIYLQRTLSAPLSGGVALLVSSSLMHLLLPITDAPNAAGSRVFLLLIHLMVGSLAYIGGYLLMPPGRSDLAELTAKIRL